MMNWYAAYIKSRHEFVAESELSKKEIETFLPSIKKLRTWKDRKKWIEFPLFPGYLFVRTLPSYENFLHILKTRGVVRLISSDTGDPIPVPDEEITSLRLMLESGKDIDIYPNLKEGSRVRIKRGPLTGAEGTLKIKDDQYTFFVNIDILGRSVGVKIYAEDLELI
ncbi:MAG: UpxY family transcription antiterminator [Thermodesulfovibrionales bacterium]